MFYQIPAKVGPAISKEYKNSHALGSHLKGELIVVAVSLADIIA